ncbi:hypothetical protein [Candidatus Magnetaquicoccus inordinatus]|uniref:hypothetical protein n=1 Tax=Candidatus Magnetaquicoccus inordinatus TaxID=2496818 RepID=UPI00102AC80F|nr:hypothetical protein [Candidatus Magnetaquicoccus inordinatus]
MIPVSPQSEPAQFNSTVRQKGLAYLHKRGLALDKPLPPGTTIESYWRSSLDDLYRSYQGTCAYLAVYFDRGIGAASVDHFVAKSSLPGLAYEWSNYRLACLAMNSRKNSFDDLLDPFTLEIGWFHLELLQGRIFPNPHLTSTQQEQVQKSIKRLGLDDPLYNALRRGHYQDYINGDYTERYLQKISPFVWMEAQRQGLL